MPQKGRRNICKGKNCGKRTNGLYYRIEPVNKDVWLCKDCIKNITLKLHPIIK